MPQAGFDPTIPVFERAKTVHALDRAVTEAKFVTFKINRYAGSFIMVLNRANLNSLSETYVKTVIRVTNKEIRNPRSLYKPYPNLYLCFRLKLSGRHTMRGCGSYVSES
jgi:hypothetical protein